MQKIKNIEIEGKHKRPILLDLFYMETGVPKDVVIFCHGYKGYKDWGAWDLVAEQFAKNNFAFLKMNFSHNGGTPEQPIDFPDLEAFGNNNFLIELDDLNSVINFVHANNPYQKELNANNTSLIGHSRGGGIVVLKAGSDQRVHKIITWAGVSDFGSRFPKGETLELWKENGVAYISNARTKQQMPHYYQFYKSFKDNESRLTISTAAKQLNIPYLVIHGNNDETVSVEEAQNLASWNSRAELQIIEGANHTFGSAQPFAEPKLPVHLSVAVENSINFLKA